MRIIAFTHLTTRQPSGYTATARRCRVECKFRNALRRFAYKNFPAYQQIVIVCVQQTGRENMRMTTYKYYKHTHTHAVGLTDMTTTATATTTQRPPIRKSHATPKSLGWPIYAAADRLTNREPNPKPDPDDTHVFAIVCTQLKLHSRAVLAPCNNKCNNISSSSSAAASAICSGQRTRADQTSQHNEPHHTLDTA